MSGGRPTEYKDEFCDTAKGLAEQGATDDEIAEALGIHRATYYRWRALHAEFCDAIKSGKEVADNRVERSLYERAVGYSYPEEKIFQHNGAIVRAETKKHYPPDTTAAIFWLKNRKPEDWRDKREHEHTGSDGGPIVVVSGVEREEKKEGD